MGGNAETAAVEDLRKAIRTAMRGLSAEHPWPYLTDFMYLNTQESYTTGTIAYTAATRTVVLTGGTWPSWADMGSIVIGIEHARVQKVVDSTTIILLEADAPVEDYSGSFTFYQYRFLMPANLLIYKFGKMQIENTGWLDYVPYALWETDVRKRYLSATGIPRWFTINRDVINTGRTVVSLWPYPTTAQRLRFAYIRHPNDVAVWSYETGRVTTALSTDVVGTETVFNQKHVGCVIRTGSDQVNPPTDQDGTYPYVDEAIISEVTDSENLVTSTALENAQTTVAYVISSLMDVDVFSMQEVLLYRARLELAKIRRVDNIQDYVKDYEDALYSAKCQAKPNNTISKAGTFRNSGIGWDGIWSEFYTLS